MGLHYSKNNSGKSKRGKKKIIKRKINSIVRQCALTTNIRIKIAKKVFTIENVKSSVMVLAPIVNYIYLIDILVLFFMLPDQGSGEHIVAALSVRPSVRPSVCPSVRPSRILSGV